MTHMEKFLQFLFLGCNSQVLFFLTEPDLTDISKATPISHINWSTKSVSVQLNKSHRKSCTVCIQNSVIFQPFTVNHLSDLFNYSAVLTKGFYPKKSFYPTFSPENKERKQLNTTVTGLTNCQFEKYLGQTNKQQAVFPLAFLSMKELSPNHY